MKAGFFVVMAKMQIGNESKYSSFLLIIKSFKFSEIDTI